MKKCCSLLAVFLLLLPVAVRAHMLEELWHKYAPAEAQNAVPQKPETPPAQVRQDGPLPGRMFGAPQGQGESAFDYGWKYRAQTYELHYEHPAQLARSVYGLALFAGDVSRDLPREKFYAGVLGYHYSVWQVCHWLNDCLEQKRPLDTEEARLVGMLLQDGVVRLAGRFEPGEAVRHMLAAAPGKKRTFAANLRHERLHVFWDEDHAFQSRNQARWIGLTEEERQAERDKLKNYAQGNEQQLIEEWAVHQAESAEMSLK